MRFVGLTTLALAVGVWAQEPTFTIENVCDTLTLSSKSTVNLSIAYIDESNWYGNPHTMAMDSSNSKRHESYSTLQIKNSSFGYKMPVSIDAACSKKSGVELTYAKWNSSKVFVEDVDFDDYSTYIMDARTIKGVGDYNKDNAYNFFVFVPGSLPEDETYEAGQLLVSQSFEFEFSWWYVGLIYSEQQETSEGTRTTNHYSSSIAMDSASAYNSARNGFEIPDAVTSFRIQAVRVVLKDSRKLKEEESVESSASDEEISSSSEEIVSSDSEEPVVSSSSEESAECSSSEEPEISSSSEEVVSSSSEEPEISSSSEEASSSSVEVVIRNVCDTLGQSGDGTVVLALDFIDEVNWYGNPRTLEQDSVFAIRHESVDDLNLKLGSFNHKLPLSITAACKETSETDFVFATWNSEKKLETQKAEAAYSTRIFDMNETSFGSYNSGNSNNVLVFVDGELPQDNSFKSDEIMVSRPYELEFEWWFLVLSYDEEIQDGEKTGVTTRFKSAASMDSLSAFNAVYKSLSIPESVGTLRVQSIKAVLKDSRKLTGPASSAEVASSSSSEKAKSSSSEKAKSSSSKDKPVVSSSSEDSDEGESSSSAKVAKSSSSGKGKSSSSKGEKSELVYGLRTAGVLLQEVQVRYLDGTVVPADKKLVPGVYYVKMSDGTWKKKAVLPK
ncbi:hypothetical protein [Fibrobacter sp.]|uniref:hypothetical protein n=1 Tax=Fibrobacter sp. TaxID=35828 RepID=UPI003890BE0F